jgi:hypothetical protein
MVLTDLHSGVVKAVRAVQDAQDAPNQWEFRS